jgi:hypothetical protein
MIPTVIVIVTVIVVMILINVIFVVIDSLLSNEIGSYFFKKFLYLVFRCTFDENIFIKTIQVSFCKVEIVLFSN